MIDALKEGTMQGVMNRELFPYRRAGGGAQCECESWNEFTCRGSVDFKDIRFS